MVLPHNPKTEAALIGSILLSPVVVLEVCSKNGVSPDWFYDSKCRTIAECIWKMAHEGRVDRIDVLTLTDYMRAAGCLDSVGGSLFIEQTIDACPTAAHCESYIDEVGKQYKKRRGILLCKESEEKYALDSEPDDVTSTMVSRLIEQSVDLSSNAEDFFKRDQQLRTEAKGRGYIGLPSNFKDVHMVKGGYSPDEGECVVISGRSSHGKTLLMTDELVHWARDLNEPVGLVELDMSERMWRRRTAAAIAEVNSFKFDYGNATEEDNRLLDEGWRTLNNLPLYVTERRLSIGEILAWATMMKIKKGIKVLAIDHLTKIRMTKEDFKQDHRWMLGDWVTRIQDFGKRFGILTIILAQSNTRDSDKYLDKTPPIAGMGSIKESGAIEENADCVITINKKPEESIELYTKDNPFWEMVLNIAKNRARGPTGLVPIFLWTWRQRFCDYSKGLVLRDNWARDKRMRD